MIFAAMSFLRAAPPVASGPNRPLWPEKMMPARFQLSMSSWTCGRAWAASRKRGRRRVVARRARRGMSWMAPETLPAAQMRMALVVGRTRGAMWSRRM